MLRFKTYFIYVFAAAIICFFNFLTDVAASDEQQKIKQLELLLQFYMQENAKLKSKVQELEARVNLIDANEENIKSTEKMHQNSTPSESGSKDTDELKQAAATLTDKKFEARWHRNMAMLIDRYKKALKQKI